MDNTNSMTNISDARTPLDDEDLENVTGGGGKTGKDKKKQEYIHTCINGHQWKDTKRESRCSKCGEWSKLS